MVSQEEAHHTSIPIICPNPHPYLSGVHGRDGSLHKRKRKVRILAVVLLYSSLSEPGYFPQLVHFELGKRLDNIIWSVE